MQACIYGKDRYYTWGLEFLDSWNFSTKSGTDVIAISFASNIGSVGIYILYIYIYYARIPRLNTQSMQISSPLILIHKLKYIAIY